MRKLLILIMFSLMFIYAQVMQNAILPGGKQGGGGGATPAIVQSKYCNSGCGNSSATLSLVYNTSVTAGSGLAAFTINNHSSSTTDAVSDSVNGAWTKGCGLVDAGNGLLLEVWYIANVAGGATTVTATLTGNSFGKLDIIEASGVAHTSMLDGCNSGGPTFGGTHATATSFTTTVSGDLLLGFGYSTNSTCSNGTNFTWSTIFSDSSLVCGESSVQPSAGGTVIDLTVSSGTWDVIGMAFQP